MEQFKNTSIAAVYKVCGKIFLIIFGYGFLCFMSKVKLLNSAAIHKYIFVCFNKINLKGLK